MFDGAVARDITPNGQSRIRRRVGFRAEQRIVGFPVVETLATNARLFTGAVVSTSPWSKGGQDTLSGFSCPNCPVASHGREPYALGPGRGYRWPARRVLVCCEGGRMLRQVGRSAGRPRHPSSVS